MDDINGDYDRMNKHILKHYDAFYQNVLVFLLQCISLRSKHISMQIFIKTFFICWPQYVRIQAPVQHHVYNIFGR